MIGFDFQRLTDSPLGFLRLTASEGLFCKIVPGFWVPRPLVYLLAGNVEIPFRFRLGGGGGCAVSVMMDEN